MKTSLGFLWYGLSSAITLMRLESWETGLKMVTASDRNWNHGIGISNFQRWSILVTLGYGNLSLLGLNPGSWPVLMSVVTCKVLMLEVKKGEIRWVRGISESSSCRIWKHITGGGHKAAWKWAGYVLMGHRPQIICRFPPMRKTIWPCVLSQRGDFRIQRIITLECNFTKTKNVKHLYPSVFYVIPNLLLD